MGQFDRTADEAAAIARVADAAREVQSASKALEERFNELTEDTPPTLPLARLTAAINELQSARDALDALLVRKSLH
jgi:predicted Zn-dependent protease